MLMLPSGIKVWVAAEPVNMNKSFDGLSYLVQEVFKQEATSGQLFIFRNRACDKIKVLYWDRTGFVQWYKRLEKGCFRFPGSFGQRPLQFSSTVGFGSDAVGQPENLNGSKPA